MELIAIEERKDKTCAFCGINKSVKYVYNGRVYCNRCILTVQKIEKDIKIANKLIEWSKHDEEPMLNSLKGTLIHEILRSRCNSIPKEELVKLDVKTLQNVLEDVIMKGRCK